MASLHIAEFESMGSAGNGTPQIAALPPLAEQVVTIGSETDSTAMSANTRFVRLSAGAACCIAIGLTPTATTSSFPLASGQVEYFGIKPLQKISVIAAA